LEDSILPLPLSPNTHRFDPLSGHTGTDSSVDLGTETQTQNRIAPPPQRLQITAGPPTRPTPPQGQGNRSSGQRQTSWTVGRRSCAKCGGPHMDWEHNYYRDNANGNRRPTKGS
jgi:hypothetical protein